MEKIDIKSLSPEELQQEMERIGEKKFRAAQLYEWMHVKLARDFTEMTNLSLSLREKCGERFDLTALEPVRVQESRTDGTKKFLFELSDGNLVESVWMQYKHGNSVCISSQVGCRMGCGFCASTLGGLERNLTAAEMLEQVYRIQALTGERVSHVVLMGSGEPFDNYGPVVRFIRLLTDERGLNISQRNITLSTCGIVPGIRRFAGEGLAVTLALSLHATTDQVRKALMPIANRYPLPEVLEACKEYFSVTGRRVTFEYSLIRGVNDSPQEAASLSRLLGGLHGHVNLIPLNDVTESPFRPSRRTAAFQKRLESHGITATVRRSLGGDIDAACGQLRRKAEKGEDSQ